VTQIFVFGSQYYETKLQNEQLFSANCIVVMLYTYFNALLSV